MILAGIQWLALRGLFIFLAVVLFTAFVGVAIGAGIVMAAGYAMGGNS